MLDAGIGVLLVLADDQHVHDRVFGLDERVIGNTGADVGKQSESFSHRDVQALVAASLRRRDGALRKTFVRRSDSHASVGMPDVNPCS